VVTHRRHYSDGTLDCTCTTTWNEDDGKVTKPNAYNGVESHSPPPLPLRAKYLAPGRRNATFALCGCRRPLDRELHSDSAE